MQHFHRHASRASSQGAHACQAMKIRSSQPTTVAKKERDDGTEAPSEHAGAMGSAGCPPFPTAPWVLRWHRWQWFNRHGR
eukprot:621226-Pleurochrysis_carterae.AAC.1